MICDASSRKGLVAEYKRRRSDIRKRLEEFRSLRKASGADIFAELCFCITTANANALMCDKAIKELKDADLILTGTCGQVRPKLKGRVRFHNKKAEYIVGARKQFRRGKCIDMKRLLGMRDVFAMREWLVRNVKGLGYKEASHFLRNIGLGRDIAILDRHILKNLKNYGAIGKIPASVGSQKIYVEIENRMRRFSRRVGIPMAHLDLLFWSMQTGFIFK